MPAHPSPAPDPPGVGDEIDLDVTGVAHPGRFVGRSDGRPVFVAGTDVGERVRVRLTAVHPRYLEAELLTVLEPSSARVPHVWPEADVSCDPEARVGGADYGHLRLARQRELKAMVLHEAFERVGRFGAAAPRVPVETAPGREDGLHWRTRELLHVAPDGAVGAIPARSHTVVPVASLPLVADDLLATGVLRRRFEPGARIRLARDEDGPARLLVQTGAHPGDAEPPVVRIAAGRRFRVAADGFWQVHAAAADTLGAAVRAAVPAGEFRLGLDLFGGVGLLAAALADRVLRVVTVESDRTAARLARGNLADLSVRVLPGRVDRALARPDLQRSLRGHSPGSGSGVVVVLDPPRAGAGKAVLAALTHADVARIVYVACDPVSLARDARVLVDAGYRLGKVRAFDLFPHSHHLESVAVFDRE